MLSASLSGALVLAALASYLGGVAIAPLPELRPVIAGEATTVLTAETAPAEAAVAAQARPSAIGWLHDDEVWSNDEADYRIASITKLVTVLAGLERAPVDPGADGPVYTVSAADAALVDEVIAQDGTFAPAPVGQQLTTRQLLELILVPSANNYAISYARWVFGSDAEYLRAANDWLARNGLDSLHIVDAAGLSDENTGSAADVVRLTRLALDHPLVAEIVALPSVEIPGIGPITTTNRLLGDAGVIGVKTGTTFPEGYSLAAAQQQTVAGRELVAVAATLNRADGEARAGDTRALLRAAEGAVQQFSLVASGDELGHVTTWQGERVPLLAAGDLAVALAPGESVETRIALEPLAAGRKGAEAGSVRAASPDGEHEVPVVTAVAVEQPGFWWRVGHPLTVFGWYER